ncbi:MAG: hypothetical protein AAF530_23900 [Pseudomonadota bacterium]
MPKKITNGKRTYDQIPNRVTLTQRACEEVRIRQGACVARSLKQCWIDPEDLAYASAEFRRRMAIQDELAKLRRNTDLSRKKLADRASDARDVARSDFRRRR